MKNKKTFILFLILLIVSVIIFMISFHNLDLCHNLNRMQIQANYDFQHYNLNHRWYIYETDLLGNTVSLSFCYRMGISIGLYSFISTLILSIITGYLIKK